MKMIMSIIFALVFSATLCGQKSFIHTTTSANTNLNYTSLGSKWSDQNIYIVSHNWGSAGKYNNHPLAVKSNTVGTLIMNADGAKMPAGIAFNVLVIPKGRATYVHKVSRNNSGHISKIIHKRWNANRNAKLLITQNYDGVYNANPVGIYYAGDKWAIYNQNKAKMPVGASYFIYECPDCEIIEAARPSGNFYNFNASAGNKNAKLFVGQYWTKVYNPHYVGLWYNNGKWSIYNEDRKNMPTNAKFIVGKGISGLTKRIPAQTTTYRPLNAQQATLPGKLNLTLSGISVDDHAENTWGEIRYTLQKKEGSRWIDVKPIGKSNATMVWKRSKSNPLMCHPFPKTHQAIKNINTLSRYDVNIYGLNSYPKQYRLKCETKLTCNHKDNFMAANGDIAMPSFVTEYLDITSTDKPDIITFFTKEMKTTDNRLHKFRVQFTATEE